MSYGPRPGAPVRPPEVRPGAWRRFVKQQQRAVADLEHTRRLVEAGVIDPPEAAARINRARGAT